MMINWFCSYLKSGYSLLRLRFLLVSTFVFSFYFTSHSAIERYFNRLTPVVNGGTYTTYDDKFYDMQSNGNWQNEFTNYQVKNRVRLGIMPDAPLVTNFTGSVVLSIVYKQWNVPTLSFQDVSISRTLTVNFDATGTAIIDDLSTAEFSGGHHVKVVVSSVSGLPASSVYLETEIDVERYYAFDGLAPQGLQANISPDGKYVDFKWHAKKGAESYELEWVHVNDYTMTFGVYALSSSLLYNFYLNSTRVEVSGSHYRIPKIFDHGYIVYRVRAIGKHGSLFDKRKEGVWDVVQESGIVSAIATGHALAITTEYDEKMNWTHQVGYTEGGKRFEGVSYADGLGRGRQSVAMNPVSNQVIVSNVYYDDMGRGVVSDLPTPVSSETMHHFMNFNLSIVDQSPYNYVVFDGASESCVSPGLGFSSASGAGKYYSSSNTNQEGSNSMVPDAEHFPFSRVRYKDDYSGRVKAISSAGSTLSKGQGHETEFVYPSTNQIELDRLFGSEVGYRSHYEKMITIDANGQVYVQYSDLAGRVIASYLMGPSPTNLDALAENQVEIVENPLLVDGIGQEVTSYPSTSFVFTEYFAENNEDYNFSYSFTPSQYQSSCLPSTICYDCVYDYTLKIVDECGVVYLDVTNQVNGLEFDTECNSNNLFISNHTIPLPKGTYTISKTLKVNTSAIDSYWCSTIDNSTCIESVSDIFEELYLSEEFVDCDEQALYDESAPINDCGVSREMMLEDLSPGGQYAQFDISSGVYSVSSPISVLGTPSASASPLVSYTSVQFKDANNNLIYVTNSSGTSVLVSSLSLTDYIELFEPAWAESLLPYHPEYCYLEFCESNSASSDYEASMLSTYELSAACLAGYLAPTGYAPSQVPSSCSVVGVDPFFASNGLGYGFVTQMNSLMNNYVTLDGVSFSMWQVAIVMGTCPEANNAATYLSCLSTYSAGHNTCLDDMIWISFRELYLAAKAQFLINARIASCSGEVNGCIGNIGLGCVGNVFQQSVSCFGNPVAIFGSASTDAQQAQAEAELQAEESCNQTCLSYADEWISQFSGCDLSSVFSQQSQLTALRNELAELCGLGCDLEHPYGATTAPATLATTNGNTTINEVLEYHFNLAGSTFVESTICSELLVSRPGPYQPTSSIMGAFTEPLDECACEAILQAEYDLAHNTSYPTGVNSLEEILAFNTGVSLDDAHHLVCACDKKFLDGGVYVPGNVQWLPGANAFFAASGYEVPADLSCSTSECLGCTTVQNAVIALSERFSGTANFEQSANYSVLLTNYLNNTFFYNLEYGDYSDFLEGCNASSSSPNCSATPFAEEWLDLMTVLTLRGTLMNNQSAKVDMLLNNIIYSEGSIQSALPGKYYWSSQTGTTLTLYYGSLVDNCSINLTATTPGFDFSKIVKFDFIYTSTTSCSSNPTFDVEVTYLSCGEYHTTTLSGSSTCFDFVRCECGNNGQLLCNTTSSAPAAGDCYQPHLDQLIDMALEEYSLNVQSAYSAFSSDYLTQCSEAFNTEDLSYTGKIRTYQYTLFYYDQAGNLVRTIAPQGVNRLTQAQAANVTVARNSVISSTNYGVAYVPTHSYKTSYQYNSYNQLVSTSNPDQEDPTHYWYDRYGRIAASQNPQQALIDKYSYSLYDKYGRPVQVGQVINATALTDLILKADDLAAGFKAWVMQGTRTEVTVTTYDKTLSSAIASKFANGQQNLRLRVATVAYFESVTGATNYQTAYTSAIHYSYDIHGNVVEQLQDVPMLAPVQQDVKSTQYEFELLSGNVKKVDYQKGKADQMRHEYEYDRLNRLTEVFTTNDAGTYKERQAHYFYYDYGPLARVELGQNKVQGMDYVYTINGWMKGMNSSFLNSTYDAGKDGRAGYLVSNPNEHKNTAIDVASYTLGYFSGDYKAINTASQFEASYAGLPFDIAANNLYNGNIRSLVTSINGMNPLGTAYRYDQLQRLKTMTAFDCGTTPALNSWVGIGATTDYFNSYTYDRNGNIINLQRNGKSTINTQMDNFEYSYTTVLSQPSNRLDHVVDGVNAVNYTDDIDNQSTGNYGYDRLGQLTKDEAEGILEIEWRSGDKKIKRLTRDNVNGAGKPNLEFIYNPFGQRIIKIVKPNPGTTDDWKYTYYTYDANGQVMAMYDINQSTTLKKVTLSEHHLYGASRLGMRKADRVLFNNGVVNYPTLDVQQHKAGVINYEITNYLGNVNVVINDRKTWNATGAYFEAVSLMKCDYYPFGMEMPGRKITTDNYRYGYNGMEKDDEAKGEGNSYTTEFRQYDPRLGRWLSLDPLMAQFPNMSPYCSFNNNPVYYTDPYGLSAGGPDGEPVIGNEGCESNDGTVVQQNSGNYPTEDELLRTQGNTKTGYWNSKTYEYMKDDKTFKYQACQVMNMAKRMNSKSQEVWGLKPVTGNNIFFDATTDEGFGYVLLMNYKTSKGNLVEIKIPLYYYSDIGNSSESQPTLSKLNWEDITNFGTNCHAHALGLVGHLNSPDQIIKDDYKLSSKRKVGDVGVFKNGDHSLKIIGEKNGEFIYSSNWMGDEKVEGTWAELQEKQFNDKIGSGIKESDFIWYEKKK